MPPLPSPGNVIKCEMIFDLDGKTGPGSRFFLSYTGGPPTATGLNNLAAALGTYTTADLESLMNTTVSLATTKCTDLSSSTGAIGTAAPGVTGTRTGSGLPLNACVVIDYVISRRYRGGKPRGYWPFGVVADMVGNDTWSSTLITQVNSGFGSFMASVLAFTLATCTLQQHVNVSWYEGFTNYTGSGGRAKVRNSLRSGGPVVDNVSTHSTRTVVGSQRRRLTAA